ncbi:GreA/GreB family elongation factor [uncultured Jatrophihabitans sp.]|uniref:GreA/GreB family elongation factor n=1 Tax=uncultured Jatrophihabitans sp. TaxID=1610747 RepID=UPI0035CB8B95
MTATLDFATRNDLLLERLAALQEERAQVQREIAPQGKGDEADRATNVDGHVRLAMLDQRVAAVEAEIAQASTRRRTADSGVVEVGAVVTVDFGDGPEDFLLGSVEQAAVGLDVITPGSPLGRALLGSRAGDTVSYSASRRTLSARVVAAV